MDKYCNTLELYKILGMLSEKASNVRTKELISGIVPETDIDIVRREMKKTAEAFDLSVKNGTPPFYNFSDVRKTLDKASSGASLSLRELLDIAKLLRQIRELDEWFKTSFAGDDDDTQKENSPLYYLFSALTPNKRLEKRIVESIISEDEIADTASPELGEIRRKIVRAGLRIRESLDKMIRSSEVQKSLQENIVTIRDGRYVLPVRAEYKSNVQGIVHASSASGSTLFIEPAAVVEANNDIRILKDREQEEIDRIIAELSAECGSCAEFIARDFETCAEINLYFAKSELAISMNACEPHISDDGFVSLIRARHPLIDSGRVVPVDIELGGAYDTLIVTGPNTGGKTVLLKTVGLLTAMVMCGLMIPASDGSRVSVFKNILVDIGDMQSIENDLSTFSSHMGNVADIVGKTDTHSLVLLDELGSGTDPVEGAALAVAIINAMRERGSRIMVTTHYQELKLYAISTDGVENGSCEFDMATLRPTYRLIIGSPGQSNAFSISAKLGLPANIIDNAKALVSDENKRFDEVIGRLESSRLEYEKLNEETRRLNEEQERIKTQLESDRKALEDRKEAELDNARTQAMRIVEDCRLRSDELLDELAEIRKQKNRANFESAAISAKSRSRSVLDSMYKTANPVVKKDNDGYKLPRALRNGDNVLIFDINKRGVVFGAPDRNGEVYVQAGNIRMKTNINNLRLVDTKDSGTNTQRKTAGKVTAKGVRGKMERRPQFELDIRGKAVDEGILEVDAFIDNAVMTNAGLVTIIHGKGTGLLRNGIQRHLREHPSVKSFRNGVYGEGENGVTIVELK